MDAPPSAYRQATRSIENQDWKDALPALMALRNETPEVPSVTAELARVKFILGDRVGAVQELRAFGAKYPRSQAWARLRADTLSRSFRTVKGQQVAVTLVDLMRAGKLPVVKESLAQAIAEEGPQLELLVRLGQASVLAGSADQALEALSLAEKLDSREPEVYLWRGRAYALKKEFEPAIEALTLANGLLRSDPQRSELSIVWLAQAFAASGDLDRARGILESDLERHPLHVHTIVALEALPQLVDSKRENRLRQLGLSRVDQYKNLFPGLGFNPVTKDELRQKLIVAGQN